MNNLTIEPKIIIFGPLLPIRYKFVHENDKNPTIKQLYYNICVTVLAVSYSFFLNPSYFFYEC